MPCGLFPWQTQTQALLDLAEMFLAWLAGNGVDGQWGFRNLPNLPYCCMYLPGCLVIWATWNIGKLKPYLSLNSSLLFLSDWLPPSLLSGHGSGKEKESSQAGNARKKLIRNLVTWQLITVGKKFVPTSTKRSHFLYICQVHLIYLDFHVFCCSQICGHGRQWRFLQLRWHPDKNPDKLEARIPLSLIACLLSQARVEPYSAMSYSTRFSLVESNYERSVSLGADCQQHFPVHRRDKAMVFARPKCWGNLGVAL